MEYRLSERAASLAPSMTLAITAKAKELRAAGEDVIGLGAGEPDFDTPEHIKAAAVQALADGFTKYTPAAGTPELRAAVARKFERENGLSYDPQQIIVSSGGKHSCYNVMMALCQAGDEVIIPAPYWLSYPEMVTLAGATPKIIETTDTTEFKVTPDQLRNAINENTRLFILNSPSNPTGSVYTPEEIKALGDVCVEKGVLIMSDEIYEKLIYGDAKFQSVAGCSPEHQAHTIIVHGLAKAYSMTGWRLGWAVWPKKLIEQVIKFCVNNHSCVNAAIQFGGIAALDGTDDSIDYMMEKFSKRRKLICDGLNSIKGIDCSLPGGAFYAFPNVKGTGMNGEEFAKKCLHEAGVAIVPGVSFGKKAVDYVRFSFAASQDDISQAIENIKKISQ